MKTIVSQQNDVYEGRVIVSSIMVPLDVQFLPRLGKTSRLSIVFESLISILQIVVL